MSMTHSLGCAFSALKWEKTAQRDPHRDFNAAFEASKPIIGHSGLSFHCPFVWKTGETGWGEWMDMDAESDHFQPVLPPGRPGCLGRDVCLNMAVCEKQHV